MANDFALTEDCFYHGTEWTKDRVVEWYVPRWLRGGAWLRSHAARRFGKYIDGVVRVAPLNTCEACSVVCTEAKPATTRARAFDVTISL
jgi:hypothetical protein